MTYQKPDYLEFVRRGSAQIYSAASSNLPDSLSLEIEFCPGWDLAELCRHQGFVYRFAGEHLVRRATEPISGKEISKAPENGEELLGWYQESEEFILSALEDIDPAEEIWNWSANQKDAGFWLRRMAHETTIHAWDAARAVGQDYEIDDDWGADGTDEYLTKMFPRVFANLKDLPKPSGTLHLHRTDEGSSMKEWFCEVEADEPKISYTHSKGSAAIQASGKNLYLMLWGRAKLTADDITLFGDEKVASTWLAFRA